MVPGDLVQPIGWDTEVSNSLVTEAFETERDMWLYENVSRRSGLRSMSFSVKFRKPIANGLVIETKHYALGAYAKVLWLWHDGSYRKLWHKFEGLIQKA